MDTGKQKCELLKSIRKQIAKKYELNYNPSTCHHKGNCKGFCPLCDEEIKDLNKQMEAKGFAQFEITDDVIQSGIQHFIKQQKGQLLSEQPSKEPEILEGMPHTKEQK